LRRVKRISNVPFAARRQSQNETGGLMLWHALAVNTLSEVRIRNELHEEGICSFVPVDLLKSTSKIAPDNFRAVALMPGYVFVESAHARQNWAIIRDIRGVRKILQNDGFWLTIGQGDIDELVTLQHRLQFTKLEISKRLRAGITKGAKVKVMSGPLSGHASQIIAIRGRVAEIGARLFGRESRTIKIDVSLLEAI
jgi:transcription antitermination factor NusG